MGHTEKATSLTVGFGLEAPVHRAPVKLTARDEHNRFFLPAGCKGMELQREGEGHRDCK